MAAAAKKDETDAFDPSGFADAKATAREIARRDGLDEDVVFADAMHVAVALALETEERPYSKANAARMFDRIFPAEVCEILAVRRDDPELYETLPMALKTARLRAAEIESAKELAQSLSREEMDALFFSDQVGRA